jgi:predicted dehydrogenase
LFSLDDRYELAAAALSSDPEKSMSAARELHIPRAYKDFSDMAAAETERSDRIDAVAIVTPNFMHYPVAKAFLNAAITIGLATIAKVHISTHSCGGKSFELT